MEFRTSGIAMEFINLGPFSELQSEKTRGRNPRQERLQNNRKRKLDFSFLVQFLVQVFGTSFGASFFGASIWVQVLCKLYARFQACPCVRSPRFIARVRGPCSHGVPRFLVLFVDLFLHSRSKLLARTQEKICSVWVAKWCLKLGLFTIPAPILATIWYS